MNEKDEEKKVVQIDENKDIVKKDYITPEIKTEELLAFGAICNGSGNGGRKDTTGAPRFCRANRLLS